MKKKTSQRILASVLVVIFIVGIVLMYYWMLYGEKHSNIRKDSEITAWRFADEFDKGLMSDYAAVRLTAFTLEEMLQDGKTKEELQEYIVAQSAMIRNVVSENSTALYGYVAGNYLDGEEWVPPEDYIATERPWYTVPLGSDEEVAFSGPYVDAMTGDSILSLGKVLDDGKSVVSIDISMVDFQKMIEEGAETDDLEMVLDAKGTVIAHSNKEEVGTQYDAKAETLGAQVFREFAKSGKEYFTVRVDGIRYIAYAAKMKNGWYAISVKNASSAFWSMNLILVLTIVLVAVVITIIGVILSFSSRRSQMVNFLSQQLASVADIYVSLYEINFQDDTFEELRNEKAVAEMIRGARSHCQEVLRKVMERFSDPLSREELLDFIDFGKLEERLADADTVTMEFLNKKKQWRRARYIVSERLPDGRISRGMYLIEDIDEEKKKRDQLAEVLETNNYRLWTIAKLFMAAYEVDLEHDAFSEIKMDSHIVTDLLGDARTNAQMMLRKVMENITDPEYLDEVSRFIDLGSLTDRLRKTDTVMMEYLSNQGRWRRLRFIVSRRGKSGAPTSVLWLGEDIDQERKERSRLIDMSERALAASEAKSSFLSNMSHEIRTPINAVLGLNEMILRECGDQNILNYSESIRTAGSTLLGLINDILDFSKIEAGKMEIIPVEYDLSSILNDLVNMIQTRADAKGLMLVLDFDKDMPNLLNGDEIRIKQVITNILTNAVKYTEKGSVVFGMTYEKLPEEPDSVLLQVSIKDTGIGIKEEDLKKLFSEFERIEEKRNRNVEGTGLGMNITKSLLQMMGSTLKVESIYGLGSKFSFAVKQKVVSWSPIGDYEASYKKSLKQRGRYKASFTAPTAEVLVVDDNQMNLMVFKSLLKRTGVKIDMAGSGDEALSLAYDKKYDVIFLDHMMPEKDGIETLHEMRAQKAGPNLHTTAICLTANAISGAREEYIAAGFDDYLTKPIDSVKLEEMLQNYLPEEKLEYAEEEDAEGSGAGRPDGAGAPGGVVGTGGSGSAAAEAAEAEAEPEVPEELAALKGQDWIDLGIGLKNSGTVDAYLPLLEIFYGSLEEKAQEIEQFYEAKDLKNYTIKVHALKSSARIIGAAAFGEEAQQLENAGKAEDTAYIEEHHAAFLQELRSFREPLAEMFAQDSSGKPEADAFLMEAVYEELREAAENMSLDGLDDVFKEMEDYAIPEGDMERWKAIRSAYEQYDYQGIINALDA